MHKSLSFRKLKEEEVSGLLDINEFQNKEEDLLHSINCKKIKVTSTLRKRYNKGLLYDNYMLVFYIEERQDNYQNHLFYLVELPSFK